MNVGLEFADVANPLLHPCSRHDLHDPDRSDGTADMLVQPGFLISLRRHQQVIDAILSPIFAEQFDHGLKSCSVLSRLRVGHEFGTFQVPLPEYPAEY